MTDDATKMKQERDLALAECERLRTRHWTILDDMNKSELDAYDLGCAESIAAVDKILDGKDDGSGTNNEPWYTQRKRLLSLTAECERLNDTLDKLVQWSDAYPIAVFPEPDFLKAQKVLSENGMPLDAISSSNMRRVIIGVREIIDAARGKP